MIEERKKEVMKSMPPPPAPVMDEKAKRQMELQARISQLQAAVTGKTDLISGKFPKLAVPSTAAAVPSAPGPLILDSEGRTIDLVTGKAVTLEQRGPTLKANIRNKKREDFKAVQDKVADEVRDEQPDFYDNRVAVKAPTRAKRAVFKFHDKGTFVKQGTMLRAKAQLEKLQSDIAQAAKKTGITSAAALARIAPKKTDSVDSGMIPEVEWWDGVFAQTAEMLSDADAVELESRLQKLVTKLVEHPVQLAPQIDRDKPVALPIMLTKNERKKLRRQARREKLKEEQEKQRIGLIAAPEPKVKMGNLMRVLGNEAVQDPTKVEANVRAQIAKRRKAHETANAQRKLTETEKRAKKIKKIKEDTTEEVNVAIYRVKDLSHPAKKFKVETNATQLFMTGVVVLNKELNIVIIEGGPKQQKKFKRLMLNRIKWSEEKTSSEESATVGLSPQRLCELVWEGSVKKRHFGTVKFKACATEQAARELLRKHGVEEYWDLAYGAAILESTD
ncbi:U4/U6 small nuclear ribonucleoprotein Prp3-like isoform X2 [Paramacrobiotus metropolitanus]|nr:U4/U6 small nuclear ribonucleoprotein Prp3-like isoform X2 [Paramacrobiotus metropolitanus]